MRRVPTLNKKEIAVLVEIGASNALPEYEADRQRRGALWHARRCRSRYRPLLTCVYRAPLIPALIGPMPSHLASRNRRHRDRDRGMIVLSPVSSHRADNPDAAPSLCGRVGRFPRGDRRLNCPGSFRAMKKPIAQGTIMLKPYSVLLLYPDYANDTYLALR
jgi:hypothetical protein